MPGFSCFSPSAMDTLPRSTAAKNPKAAVWGAQFPSDGMDEHGRRSMDVGGNRSPLMGERGIGSTPIKSEKSSSPRVGQTDKLLKRRSYGPDRTRTPTSEKRISKAIIGNPTNFVHVGHAGKPVNAAAAKELESTVAALANALSGDGDLEWASTSPPRKHTVSLSTPVSPVAQSSSPTVAQSRPLQRANSIATSSGQPRERLQSKARKPPPPITASVIRQAGPEAVQASAPAGSSSPALPPPIQEVEERKPTPIRDAAVTRVLAENVPLPRSAPPSPSKKPSFTEAAQQAQDEPPADGKYDELGKPLYKVQGGMYMTAKSKGRYEGALREIENALKV